MQALRNNFERNMNIKLHTPKSLKAGSGIASLKQFLLSLFATTVSIALTFGTAAIIDYNKKQGEKRKIVMMVMYDVSKSLKSIEDADSLIRKLMEVQRQLAGDTTLFKELRFKLAVMPLNAGYTETTEHIFSSSIETINTVGNVLFTENVAEFYQFRRLYKTTVCDSLINDVTQAQALFTVKSALDFDYTQYAVLSNSCLMSLKHQYAMCKQIIGVTDEEIDVYRKEREKLEAGLSEKDDPLDAAIKEIIRLQNDIDESKARLNLK